MNTRLGTDHHQLIMPPISKDCFNTFLEHSFIYAAPCEWNKLSKLSEHQILIVSERVLNNVIYTTIWMLTVNNNVYIIVIYVVITVDYCKCILL